MMISTKLSLPTLALVLVVFTIFTVSLTETIQISDGFSISAEKILFELQTGETGTHIWTVSNSEDEEIYVEVYATGPGSELMIFDQYLTVPPHLSIQPEIFVVVPDDHPDNIEYHPELFALQRAGPPTTEGGVLEATISISVQMKSLPIIKIGDNPVYTAPEVEVKTEIPPPPKIKEVQPVKEESKELTASEKIARIQAANEARIVDDAAVMGETPAETTGQFEVEDPVPELQVDDVFIPEPISMVEEEGGGCLIATATFGSELAPQVQLLREIRDNQLMGTSSGMAFMSGFNSLYYSFSPHIADMERENPAFKELVKLTITPMISTLSVMEYADSEDKVVGLGIGVILMNLGMYVGLPTFGIVKLIQFRKN